MASRQTERNEPVDRIRGWTGSGNVEVSIWENDGRYSITVQRSYKKNGDYKSSASFFPQDLPTLAHVILTAWDKISEFEANER